MISELSAALASERRRTRYMAPSLSNCRRAGVIYGNLIQQFPSEYTGPEFTVEGVPIGYATVPIN